jgi:hypothetical protein
MQNSETDNGDKRHVENYSITSRDLEREKADPEGSPSVGLATICTVEKPITVDHDRIS